MSRSITTSLSPNVTAAYIKQVWRVLFHPAEWNNYNHIHQAEKKLSHILNGKFVSLTSSGRQALYDALRAVNIGSGDEVIVQAFTCIAVPAPIQWTGAKPVYVDIDPGTYNMNPATLERLITSRTKAIIVQHTFGIPAPLEEIQTIAQKHNLLLIEDCAHALGSTYKGKLLGTFGDISILSFGRDKTISTIFGGSVVTSHQNIHDAVKNAAKQRPLPPTSWLIQQLLHPLLFQIITSLYFVGNIGKIFLVLLQRLRILSMAVEQKERKGEKPIHFAYQFSPALAVLLENQLQELPHFIEHRKQIAAQYKAHIKTYLSPTISSQSEVSWLRFPLQVSSGSAMHEYMKKHHILLGDWYYAPLVPNTNLTAFHYNAGMCPIAEEISQKVINLPTHHHISEKDAATIIELINTFPV